MNCHDVNIGYACLNLDIEKMKFKTCRICNVTPDKLMELIDNNLNYLEMIIDYNILNNIKLFRISSDVIPYGSSHCNTLKWDEIFKSKFNIIGKKLKTHHIRASMHPGQYTVLNSPNIDVVKKSIEDLIYHDRVLNALDCDKSSKIILHVGGVYGDKEKAIQRFIDAYALLPLSVKKRLVIENDDRSYTIEDVLYICNILKCPAIFDNLHNEINPSKEQKTEFEWIDLCNKTWCHDDGRQKIHYSQQNYNKNPGAHSESIDTKEFMMFLNSIKNKNIDIMLEVKDKNRSAVNCIVNLKL